MHDSKVKVALGGNISDVGWDPLLLAEFQHLCRGLRVINGAQHHIRIVQVGGFEISIDMGDLFLGDSVGNFFVQSTGRADDGDAGVRAAEADEGGQAAERREVALRHEREHHDVIGALVIIGFGHDDRIRDSGGAR